MSTGGRNVLSVGRLLGARLYVHRVWFLGCAVLAWIIVASYEEAARAGPSALQDWQVFLAGSLLFHPLVLLQETGHAAVARRYGRRVASVTLLLFGALYEMDGDGDDANTELRIAAAGPATSLVAAAACVAAAVAAPNATVAGVAWQLAWLSLALAAYALVPVRPFNGFHLIHAILWRVHGKGPATMMAAASGAAMAVPLLPLAVFALLSGQPALAVGLGLLALTLWLSSTRACRELKLSAAMEGAMVEDAMAQPPPSVPAHASLAEAEECCSRCHGDFLPVTRDAIVIGLVLRKDLHLYSPTEREGVSVQAALRPLPSDGVIAPKEALSAGLARMSSQGMGSLLVVEDGRLKGLLTPGAVGDYAASRISAARGGAPHGG